MALSSATAIIVESNRFRTSGRSTFTDPTSFPLFYNISLSEVFETCNESNARMRNNTAVSVDAENREHRDRAELEAHLSADLRALTAQSDRIGRFFAELHHLSANEFHALLHIMVGETSGTPLTAGQLRQRLGLTHSGTTYLLQRMISAGHIRRDADPSDRRKAILRYEEHGMELARAFFTHLDAANRAALAAFSDEELRTAHRVMRTLTGAMDHFRRRLTGTDGANDPASRD
jgi:DNA-binding MarR family transcriptional regulator